MVEGARLLSECAANNRTAGSNPALSVSQHLPVIRQFKRRFFATRGKRPESSRASNPTDEGFLKFLGRDLCWIRVRADAALCARHLT